MPFNTEILEGAIAHRREDCERERQKILAQVLHWLEAVGSQHGIEKAYIFGSLTRAGEFTETSDVDVAVVGQLPENFFSLMSFLSTELGREVDLIELDQCHFGHRICEIGIQWTKMP
ncbi:MAG: signal peptidase [Cyanobacteria bacterium QH_7_48_89]|jgi:predicted nucleotidyltransferase|nr:MAG: signal peptidase [Cyanobacteria bacterium QH_7_48_89]PSO89507.1 MAG: signal peptidase [Cyanobacteria bacterium QS_3_48_167]